MSVLLVTSLSWQRNFNPTSVYTEIDIKGSKDKYNKDGEWINRHHHKWMQTPDIVWCKLLKELVILTSQRIPEVGIQAVEGILPKVLYLIPWIENREMLVCTRKSQLYPNTAIYRTPSIFTAWCSNGTVLFVETNESGVSWAFSTSISFPVQIFQPTLLKLEYLQQSPFDIR